MASTRCIEVATRPSKEEWKRVYQDIKAELVKAVQTIEQQTRQCAITSRDSIYTGRTGISFMHLRLAAVELAADEEEMILNAKTLLSECDRGLDTVLRHNTLPSSVQDAGHASFLETPIGAAAVVLGRCLSSLAKVGGENSGGSTIQSQILQTHWNAAVTLLLNAVGRAIAEDRDPMWFDEDGCEVLYGRAGLLYALLFLRDVLRKENIVGLHRSSQVEDVESLASDASVRSLVDSIIARGKHGAERYARHFERSGNTAVPPLMWSWHGKRYLGGAHGVVGILQMLLICPKPIIEDHISEIMSTVQWLISCQDEEGNWPTKAPDPRIRHRQGPNDLVQWCHGAPGFLILLSTVLRKSSGHGQHFQLDTDMEDKVISSLRRGAAYTYKHGLLRNGVGLCHGVAGSVYALLAVSGVLDSATGSCYLAQAAHLAHLAIYRERFVAEKEMTIPDHPWSLYEGLAGMCCAWVEVLSRLEVADKIFGKVSGMPGYDDLP